MSNIIYIKGDATEPVGTGPKYIVHICNDIGAWGAGFVVALSEKWPEPEDSYRKWNQTGVGFGLGSIQPVAVSEDITVINMIAQHGIRRAPSGKPPIRYEFLKQCLEKVATEAAQVGASVHMPRIGCGLAGGLWEVVEGIIKETLIKHNINVIVYDLQ